MFLYLLKMNKRKKSNPSQWLINSAISYWDHILIRISIAVKCHNDYRNSYNGNTFNI